MIITVTRTAILYFLVIFAIRVMGKRQIGDMQPGELVITILISEIAAIPIQDMSQPMLVGVVAIFTLISIEVIISIITMKFLPARKIFYGDSAIIIKDGIIDQKMLKKLRITVTDLTEILRGEDIFDVRDVDYAILETNGRLSVLQKQGKQNVVVEDINVNRSKQSLPCLVISDGRVIDKSLKIAGISKKDVFDKLKDENTELKNVFLMTVDKYKNYVIIRKDENL